VWPQTGRYIGLMVLRGLIIGGVPMAAGIVFMVIGVAGAGLAKASGNGGMAAIVLFVMLAVLAGIAAIAYMIWMQLRLALAFPACVIEQIGVTDSLKRSAVLSQGSKGRIFVLYLLIAALSYIVSFAVNIPLTILILLIAGTGNPERVQVITAVLQVISYGVSFTAQALIQPVSGIALTLFYYDQRIRQEGYDIERMMQKAGLTAVPPLAPVELQQAAIPVSEASGEIQ